MNQDTINSRIADRIIKSEGGEAHCVEGDRGGWTSAGGISSAYMRLRHPELSVEESEERVKRMTRDEAKSILIEDFIDPFADLRPLLRGPVASAAVNMGERAAARLLQAACGDLGKRVEVDGIVGRKTLAAVKTLPDKALAKAFCRRWHYRYWKIAEANPDQAKFLAGWTNRIMEWYREVR